METIRLTDHLADPGPLYAGFGSRVLAKLIDDFIISTCFWLLALVARTLFALDRGGHTQDSTGVTVFFLLILSLLSCDGKL